MAWKSWDVYVVQGDKTVHRGVTGGVSRQSARELASTLFNIAKDKLMLVPKGSAGRKKRAATPMGPSTSSRRPAAHNPMIFRKVAKPAGCLCTRPGCGGFVRVGEKCPICEADQDLAVLDALGIGYPEDVQ